MRWHCIEDAGRRQSVWITETSIAPWDNGISHMQGEVHSYGAHGHSRVDCSHIAPSERHRAGDGDIYPAVGWRPPDGWGRIAVMVLVVGS